MTFTVNWPEWLPYERRMLIANIAGTAAVLTMVGTAIYSNAVLAGDTFREPRLRICAVAARELEPGKLLKSEDVVLRLRRPAERQKVEAKLPQYFDVTTQLVGRQIEKPIHRGEIVYDDCFIAPRRDAVLLAVSIDRASAMSLNQGAQVVLVPQGEQEQLRGWPQFEVVECLDLKTLPPNDTTVSLKLKAASATDAMRVIAATANNAKLVPLIVHRGDPKTCVPPPPPRKKK